MPEAAPRPAVPSPAAPRPWVLAAAVFAVAAAITWQAWSGARADAERQLEAAFQFEQRQVEGRVVERMEDYQQVLRGAAGLFASSESVEREEFHAYVAALRLEERYPGIQGVGFAQLVPAAGLAAHEGAVRREGFPDYAVRPPGPRETYSSIVYLEPFASRNLRAFGYDMFSEPVRREAMARARDTGRVALSGKVTLVQETDRDVQAGALLYLPVYRNGSPGRPGDLVGWAYSPYRMDDLMRGMLGERGDDVRLRLFDGPSATEGALLHDSHRGATGEPRFRVERPLEVAGHRWTLEIGSRPGLEARLASDRPRLVWLLGAGASALLALLVQVLAAGRATALAAAAQARRDLEARRRAADALEVARRALAESEGRLRTALQASSQVIWDVDVPSGVRSFGEGFRELSGREETRLIGLEAWLALIHPGDRDGAAAALQACLEGRSAAYQLEYRLATAGGWRWIRSQGRVTERDAAGRPLRLTGTLADVEERHLLQERLLAATRLASVGTLAAGVAHEINNPLSWLHANLGCALDLLGSGDARAGGRDGEVRELLQEAQQGADRIAGIVKAMRALGRPERAGLAQRVDVLAELQDALRMVRHQVGQRAELVLDVAPSLPAVQAPLSELGRVLLNLLLNAAQALPDGQRERHRVTVRALARGGEVVIEVSDTGPGLPPEVRARVFEPFFTTKPVGQGTGLGLSIAHAIVSAAGGRIEVESPPGQGATFRVVLPAAPGVEAPAAPGPAGAPA